MADEETKDETTEPVEAEATEPEAAEPEAAEPEAAEPEAAEPEAAEPRGWQSLRRLSAESPQREEPARARRALRRSLPPRSGREPREEPAAEEAVEAAPAAVSGPRRSASACRAPSATSTRSPSASRRRIASRSSGCPKPESELGRRQERRGVVVSDKGDKSIVVKVEMVRAHPKYKKVVRRSNKLHAHDEQNTAGIGDIVRIVETRPLSKTKRWRLAEIVEKAK